MLKSFWFYSILITFYFTFFFQPKIWHKCNETGLEAIDIQAIISQTENLIGRGKYNQWTDESRYEIGDYARKNRNASEFRCFRSKYPQLKESTVHSFKTRIISEVKRATKSLNL